MLYNDPISRRSVLGLASCGLAGMLKAIPLADIKLGVTSDEIDEDPATAAALLNRFGLHYAEARSIWGKYNTSQPPDKVREARAIFDKHHVQTSIVDTAFFRGPISADSTALDKEWTLLDQAMDRADIRRQTAPRLRLYGRRTKTPAIHPLSHAAMSWSMRLQDAQSAATSGLLSRT